MIRKALLGMALFALLAGCGPAARPAGETWTRPSDGMVTIYVPAGEFLMGSTHAQVDEVVHACSETGGDCRPEWFGDEQPQHKVYLDAFWVDRTEVTNGQYRKCVEAGACQAPTTCDMGIPTYSDASKVDHPVVCVNWDAATAYCVWAGARLPSEAEWERAARGTDGRVYPWGNEWGPGLCNSHESGGGRTTVVGSYPGGASRYGVLDMAGNVWEWTADWYGGGYYGQSEYRNPPGPASGEYRAMRGGSWNLEQRNVRSSSRLGLSPPYRLVHVGFRCVVSAR